MWRQSLAAFLFCCVVSFASAADTGNCDGIWSGHSFLIKLDQPVVLKHQDGVAVVAFYSVEPVAPAVLSIVAQGFWIDGKTHTVKPIDSRVDTVKGAYGLIHSEATGCAFDLGFVALKPAVRTHSGYLIFETKPNEDAGLIYVNYIGSRLEDIDAEQMKAFTDVRAGSYKTTRKVWMSRDGRMFEGDYFSQNETEAIVYRTDGQKFVLAKDSLSDGDQLFLERCQYGQDDMRDYNSYPYQYLPAKAQKN